MQITQELCKRPGLNKTGFDMPTIYVPTLTGKVWLSLANMYTHHRDWLIGTCAYYLQQQYTNAHTVVS